MPILGDIWSKAPSVSRMNADFRCLMVNAVWVHAQSLACSSNSSIKAVRFISFPCLSLSLPVWSFPGCSWYNYHISILCCSPFSSIMSTGNFSSQLVLSGLYFQCLNTTLGTWCLIPARLFTSTSSSSSHHHDIASSREASTDVINRFRRRGRRV